MEVLLFCILFFIRFAVVRATNSEYGKAKSKRSRKHKHRKPAGAHNDPNDGRLTISFSASDLDTCYTNGSSQAITFSTTNVPSGTSQCFDLNDLFGSGNGNASSAGLKALSPQLYNSGSYSPQTNYSRVWYQQRDAKSPSEGKGADRLVEVFSGPGCRNTNSSSGFGNPALEWSCQISKTGDCYQASYDIQSFSVASVPNNNGQCLTPSTGMAGDVVHGSMALTFTGFVVATLLSFM